MIDLKKSIYSYKKTFKLLSNFFTPLFIYFILVILLLNLSQKENFPLKIDKTEIDFLILKKCLSEEIKNEKLADIIIKTSIKYKFDIYLLFGIIKTYSDFKPKLITEVSNKKYYGLFQLDSEDYLSYKPSSLLNPELNIKLGIKKIRSNLKISKNNEIKALAVLKSGESSNDSRYGRSELTFIENIYKERDRFKQIVDIFIKQNYDL